jgi:dolichol-phosphate mannosyltransferase
VRALVTGAGGFVGANLVRRLLRDGHRVDALVRPGSDAWRLKDLVGDAEVAEVDLLDGDAVERALRDAAPDRVFHLAAHGAYSWQRDLEAILATNVVATARLVEASLAAGVEAFVHAGSSSEYGFQDHPPREDELPEPNSAYAVGKAAATLYCGFAGRREGRRVSTLRLYSIYGPWEEPGRLVPTLVERGLAGELPPLVAPETARDFVYVDDAVDAFVRAAEAPELEPGAVLNVASGRQTTLREVVDAARRVLPIAAEPEWGTHEARDWDATTWVGDPSAAETALGWRASTPLDEGLRRTAEWMGAEPGALGRYSSGRK